MRLKGLWVCNSGIGLSETFLGESIEQFNSLFHVKVVCGAPPTSARRAGVYYGSFGAQGLKLTDILLRKLWGFDFRLWRLQRRCRSDLIRASGVVRPQFLWFEFGTTAWIAKKAVEHFGCPYFIHVHGYDVSRAFGDKQYKSGFVTLANGSEGVICASHHVKRLCVIAGVDESKVVVIRLAIEAHRFPEREQKTQYPSFVHLGRLTGKKGPLVTLKAFELVQRSIPEARMTFIGDGPLAGELQSAVKSWGLEECVTLKGEQPWEASMKEVSKHWVFCQHSLTYLDGDQEGFGLSPAEAAMMGMPVVSTWHDGIPEHVIDGVTGWLVKEHDYESMALKMLDLIQHSQRREEMGAKGHEKVKLICSRDKRLESLKELLLLGTKHE